MFNMLVVSSWRSLVLELYRMVIPTVNPQQSYTRNVETYTSDPLIMARYVRWLGGDQEHLVELGACSQEALQLVCIAHYVDLTLFS